MATRELIGVYDCWSCGKEVPVKRTEHGKLSAPCQWCDFPHYANEGTEHYGNLIAKVRGNAPAVAPENDQGGAPAVPKAAAKPASRHPFGRRA